MEQTNLLKMEKALLNQKVARLKYKVEQLESKPPVSECLKVIETCSPLAHVFKEVRELLLPVIEYACSHYTQVEVEKKPTVFGSPIPDEPYIDPTPYEVKEKAQGWPQCHNCGCLVTPVASSNCPICGAYQG